MRAVRLALSRLALVAVLVLVPALVLTGCATVDTSKSPLHPAATIDAARFYTGTWYEIGRRPMKLTDGCVAGGTTYTPQGGTKVKVLDFCYQGSPTGKRKTIGGPARIVDPGSNAKLHVSYRFLGIVPVRRDYWVLDVAPDYSWFISADPMFHDLWIYTRNPRPSQAEIAPLVTRAKALGYDTSLLEFPATGG
ncbi:MAG: lipocalin family protein [Novosphingobium sp.]|nr:lipocalin family protein [Novosphingobium sp.]